ncbi:hypothetical protein COLO4_02802 [Corchorus olitorius]|uniref:Uncharacterized protein n=1 Tax=Corchorus olitorius TaxID=93759 RepID=A0A1R3L098_9ROSI|nr:hypothetical protein COLO4_02802 [Corchorus olitorius]
MKSQSYAHKVTNPGVEDPKRRQPLKLLANSDSTGNERKGKAVWDSTENLQ